MRPPSTLSHVELLHQLKAGTLVLGVRPAEARKFYTDLPRQEVVTLAGAPQDKQMLLVRSVMAAEGLLFIASLVLTVPAFQLHALWLVPLIGFIYFVTKSAASAGRPGLVFPALLWLAGATAALRLWLSQSPYLSAWCLTTSSLPLLSRLVYRLAARFVRRLVLTTPSAFYALREPLLILLDAAEFHRSKAS